MDDMLYVAMSGTRETLIAQGNVANNLANANTTGFLADLNQFRSMPVFGDGYPTRVYALDERPQPDFKRGAIAQTGRSLDVAVKGGGWIAVQGRDGSEAYTRRGDLQVDTSGVLTAGNGLPVMGNSGPIALPPFDAIQIGVDGTISIRPQGSAANELAVVDRIKLVDPQYDRMTKGEDGLMRLKDGGEAPASADQRLVSGSLEGSNVNIVNEMVNMIELARLYEMQVKVMKTAEETADASASVIQPV
jgi:flagellar basal-body rod protein FlgF